MGDEGALFLFSQSTLWDIFYKEKNLTDKEIMKKFEKFLLF
jgi:hypothetical protein